MSRMLNLTPNVSRPLSLGLAMTLALSVGMLSGCFREGGPGWAADRYTYVSRTWSPQTITVVDTRTGEEIWSIDVPVGQQLVLDFERGKDQSEYMPDDMLWRVMNAGKLFGDLTSKMPAPPSHARRVDVSLRPTPETIDTIIAAEATYQSEEVFVPVEVHKPTEGIQDDDGWD